MITINWQNNGKWLPYDDVDDFLLYCSRDYAIHLFSLRIPVIIKEEIDSISHYIVNTPELLEKYQSSGKRVKLLSDCTPSNDSIEKVGFWQETQLPGR